MVLDRDDLLLPIGILCLIISLAFKWYLLGAFTLFSIVHIIRDRTQYFVGAYLVHQILNYMTATRQIQKWDRARTEFIEVTVEKPLDAQMSCQEWRYYDTDIGQCLGVGSIFYLKQIPSPDYIPKSHECEVRLPPSLLTYY